MNKKIEQLRPSTYDVFSRWLHWTMAAIIIYASIVGYGMLLLKNNQKIFHILSVLNMSFATIASFLLIIRWCWSFFRREPELPSSISTFQQNIAKLAHGIIYLCMLVVFTSGFLMLEHSYEFFWLFTIENPISNSELNDFFFTIHRVSCATLACLVVLHASAALKHHFILKNGVLRSMLSKG